MYCVYVCDVYEEVMVEGTAWWGDWAAVQAKAAEYRAIYDGEQYAMEFDGDHSGELTMQGYW